jgi:hypothetical protein
MKTLTRAFNAATVKVSLDVGDFLSAGESSTDRKTPGAGPGGDGDGHASGGSTDRKEPREDGDGGELPRSPPPDPDAESDGDGDGSGLIGGRMASPEGDGDDSGFMKRYPTSPDGSGDGAGSGLTRAVRAPDSGWDGDGDDDEAGCARRGFTPGLHASTRESAWRITSYLSS